MSVYLVILRNCVPEYQQMTMTGALVVTLVMLQHLTDCRFIITIKLLNLQSATLLAVLAQDV